jgi:hypothetical protein
MPLLFAFYAIAHIISSQKTQVVCPIISKYYLLVTSSSMTHFSISINFTQITGPIRFEHSLRVKLFKSLMCWSI